MLNEGWRRKDRGTDVVIGWVQEHGRPQTDAQIRDLEIFPRKVIEYRGAPYEEMDLDGLLARQPDLVLVDELAHTNVARLEARQALRGRGGAPRCRHQRHLDHQPAAPRVAQRRGRADHRGGPTGDGPRPGGPGRRSDRVGRHGPRGPPAQDGPRQRLPARADRRRPRELLPDREPHRPARAGPALGGRSGRRGARRLPRPPRHRRGLGDQGAGGGVADRIAGERGADPAGRPDGHPDPGRTGGRARAHRRRARRDRLRGAHPQSRTCWRTSAVGSSKWWGQRWRRPWCRWPGRRTPPSW